MRRTQVMLSDEERALLDRASLTTGRSMGSLIREAVRSHFSAAPSRDADIETVQRAFGTWPEADADGAAWVATLRTGGRISP